jgi:hypothetical protein
MRSGGRAIACHTRARVQVRAETAGRRLDAGDLEPDGGPCAVGHHHDDGAGTMERAVRLELSQRSVA